MDIKRIIFVLLFVFFTFTSAVAIEINVAYENKEQPPYYMGNTESILPDKPGVAVEMVKMLEEKVDGLKVKLTRVPWKRCTKQLENNIVDGIFNASYKTSRLKIGWYPTKDKTHVGQVDETKRITTITYSLYVLKGTDLGWTGNNYDVLKGEIGAPLGYSIVGDLQKNGVEVDEAPSTKMNLHKLRKKRVAAVALQSVTADSIIKANPDLFGEIEKVQPPLKTKPYYLMLSHRFVKAHPNIAQKIWDAISNIRENNFETIAAKYSD